MKYFLAIIFCTFTFMPHFSNAEVGGWEHFQAEQLGRHGGDCEPGQSKRDFSLRDYADKEINPQGVRVKVQVVARGEDARWGVVRETSWATGVALSPSVCYSPEIESPRVVVETDATAAYLPYRGAAWWGESPNSRLAEKGRYQRGVVHLKPVGAANTLELLDPVGTFIRTKTPQLFVRTNDTVSLYGATNLQRSFIGFWQNNTRVARYVQTHSGLVGTRSYQPGQLSDGLYTWSAVQQLNGLTNVKSLVDSFDKSCGVGNERVDYALVDADGVSAINPRGITATIVIKNKQTGAVVTESAFAPNTTISPSVCFSPEKHSLGLSISIGAGAQYFNGGVETVKQTSQLVKNAENKQYFRISAALPKRTRTVTEPIKPEFTKYESVNTLKDLYNQRWKWIPGTGISEMKQFYIDTTLPTVAVAITAGTSTNKAEAIAKVDARDMGSGLRAVRIVFVPVGGVGSVATVTVPFAVGAGLVGGPKETQSVTWKTALRPGTTYRYTATAIDVAGNEVTTAARTFTAASLTPDLAMGNFYIKSTCTPESVNFVPDAECPKTTVAVSLRNNSNGVINSGTQIPYRIEYRYPGDSTGTWTEVARGVYRDGLEAQAQSPVITVDINRPLRGTGQLRALVNMAPQTNSSIGETDFSNNTSPHRTIVFAVTPPVISLEVDRTTVRSGQTVTLSWQVEANHGVTCEVRGNGSPVTIRHEGGTTNGRIVSEPIMSTQSFVLSCTNDMGGEDVETSVVVEVVPFIDEV